VTRLEIFKSGSHTAMSGETIPFSDADIAAMAAAYDPALHEAPAVVGHPANDAPAYGWVKGLHAEGGSLTAELDQTDPQFVALVKAGRFKKLSAAFYPPDAAKNPKPGAYYLRHVGFLGAQPPAIKGLKPAQFAKGAERFLTFGEVHDRSYMRLFRNLRDWITSTSGLETADRVLPVDDLNSMADLAAQPDEETDVAQTNFAEEQRKLDEGAAANKREGERLESERKAFAEREAALKRTELGSFVDGLVKEGKVLPALKDGIVAFMEGLGDKALEFAEGGKPVKVAPLDFFKGFLAKGPKLVTFGEVVRTEDAARAQPRFNIAPGASADRSRLELHEKALAYAEAQKVDYVTAARAVGA
jgi:hypothetical protein